MLALIGVAAADRRPAAAGRARSWRGRRAAGAGHGAVLAFGVVLGLLLWHVAGVVTGDGLFHLARVRKLVELGDLHLRTVDEFSGRRAPPRLRLPALARLPGARREALRARPGRRPEPRGVAARAARVPGRLRGGRRRFGSAAAGLAVLAASLALYCFAAGHGGSYVSLALPGDGVAAAARAGRVRALLHLASRRGAGPTRPRSPPRSARSRSCTRPTRSSRWSRSRALRARAAAPSGAASAVALAAAVVPTLLALLWLRPLVDETLSHNPSAAEKRARARATTPSELVVCSRAPLPARRRGGRPYRRGRGRRARARAARRARGPPALGRVRARRDGLDARADARAGALHPLLGRRLALAVAPRGRLRPVRVRVRRRARAARPLGAARAARARRRDRRSSTPGRATSATASATAGPAVVTWFAFVGGAAALVLGLVLRARRRRASGYVLGALAAVALRAAGRRARLPPLEPAA